MKACPVCGLDLDDTYLFCPEDGSPLQRPDTSALAEESPADRPQDVAIDESNVNLQGHVVLYCPACAAEYPLTFSECPVHNIPLTKHSIATFVRPQEIPARQISGPSLEESKTRVNQEAQIAASYSRVVAADHNRSIPVEAEPVKEPLQEPLITRNQVDDGAFGYQRGPATVEATGAEPKSFRIAAIMIIVGLAVLSLVGLYALYSNVSRKPASQVARSGNKSPVSTPESEFIPTPEAALEYKEEPPAPSKPETSAASDETQKDEEPAHAVVTPPSRVAAQKIEERKPTAPSVQPPVAPQTPVAVKRQASATDLVLPRGTYGLIDARLIRMRARQTPSGYRYDLTFNLQEQAGRVTQYDRLAVITRSTSGVNHTEVMPFSHRLGAAGDLTFTISVEMKGRSEADWQGRIVCTSIGTDNQGRSLRTSFGANVSP